MFFHHGPLGMLKLTALQHTATTRALYHRCVASASARAQVKLDEDNQAQHSKQPESLHHQQQHPREQQQSLSHKQLQLQEHHQQAIEKLASQVSDLSSQLKVMLLLQLKAQYR